MPENPSHWELLYQQNATKSPLLKAFEDNLVAHLTKSHDPNGPTNQAVTVISQAKTNIAKLSRVFDEFDYPVLSYEEMKELYQEPVKFRKHMQQVCDEILPILLNENRTELNQKVIDAVGQNNYSELVQLNSKEHVALQFVQSLIVSYGQRVLDRISKDDLKTECSSTVLTELGRLANDVTLEGLPNQSEKKQLNQTDIEQRIECFYAIYGKICESLPDKAQRVIRDHFDTASACFNNEVIDNQTKNNKANEAYKAAMNCFINAVAESKKNETESQLNKTDWDVLNQNVDGFMNLLLEAKENPLIYARVPKSIYLKLDIASAFLDIKDKNSKQIDPIDSGRIHMAFKYYQEATDDFTNVARDRVIKGDTLSPPEVNFFVRVLRFITGNKKLFENTDEKLHTLQMKTLLALDKIEHKYSKQDVEKQDASNQDVKNESQPDSSIHP